jgi:hypothetical protein
MDSFKDSCCRIVQGTLTVAIGNLLLALMVIVLDEGQNNSNLIQSLSA